MNRVLEIPAFVHAIIGWIVTIIFVYAGSGERAFSGLLWWGVFLLPFAVLMPIASIVFEVLTFSITQRFLWRLFLSYLSLILVFANIYFLLAVIEPSRFTGLHSPWTWISQQEGRRLYMPDALLAIVDCFHLSCVTITTLGYGDIHPVHWVAKLVSDIEVLSGLGLVTVGLGRLFSK